MTIEDLINVLNIYPPEAEVFTYDGKEWTEPEPLWVEADRGVYLQ